LVASIVSFALAFHSLSIPLSRDLCFSQRPNAAPSSATPVSLIGSTSSVASLFVLFLCSILSAFVSFVSWMAAVPSMVVYCLVAAWTVSTLKNFDDKSYWIVVPLSYLLQIVSVIAMPVAHFYAPHSAWSSSYSPYRIRSSYVLLKLF
ncbi:hypothetical protein PMAYCL1PPCAC_07912, partial [Pristionchus mayeri]